MSAARSAWPARQDPHGGDAQFYVNLSDNEALDPNKTRWGYAVFGKVVQGMDVVDRIGNVADRLARALQGGRAAQAGGDRANRARRRALAVRSASDHALHLGFAHRRKPPGDHRAVLELSRDRGQATPRPCTSSATCSNPGSAMMLRTPRNPPRSREFMRSLRCGVPCFVMHGNRDFLLARQFCRMSGAQLLPDPSDRDPVWRTGAGDARRCALHR